MTLYKVVVKQLAHLHFEPHSFSPSFSGEWEQQLLTSTCASFINTSPKIDECEQQSLDVKADPKFGNAINMAIMKAKSLIS